MAHTIMASLQVALTENGQAHIALNGVLPSIHVVGLVQELDSLISRLNDPSERFDEPVESHYMHAM